MCQCVYFVQCHSIFNCLFRFLMSKSYVIFGVIENMRNIAEYTRICIHRIRVNISHLDTRILLTICFMGNFCFSNIGRYIDYIATWTSKMAKHATDKQANEQKGEENKKLNEETACKIKMFKLRTWNCNTNGRNKIIYFIFMKWLIILQLSN